MYCRGASSGQAGKLIRASADVWRALSRAAGRHKASRAAAPGLLMPPATFFSQVMPETQMAASQAAEGQAHAAAGSGGQAGGGSSRQERQQELLQALEDADWQEEEEEQWQQAAQAGQLAASPVSLLDGICWAVTQPPAAASFGTSAGSSGLQGSELNQWQGTDAGSAWASQGYGSSQAWDGSQLATGQLEQVVFRGSSITLLLPVSADQSSGVAARTYRLAGAAGGALTCGQLLQHVYEHYQQEAPHEELLQLLQHDGGARVAVWGLVQAGEAVVRGDLLGAACACEGLRRVGPSSSAVYQLQLTQ